MPPKKEKEKGKQLNPFQHARLRPDAYIGPVQTVKCLMYVYDDKSGVLVQKEIKFNAGLLKIFVEVMSNAIDNKWRSESHSLQMKKIEFILNEETGEITVWNDGYCIPVEKNIYEYEDERTGEVLEEELYPAELFFGRFRAGTNFESDDNRKSSGTYGVGAKATNIFSTEFEIEHTDPENRKRLVQKYYDGAKRRDEPQTYSFKNKTGYTKITFKPDYEFFKYPTPKKPGMSKDLYALLKKHAYDCAMITGLHVIFNGEKIDMKSLGKYARMYFPDAKENPSIEFSTPGGGEAVLVQVLGREENIMNDIPNISFVNGVHTKDGGKHVAAWRDSIIPALVSSFNSKRKKKGMTTTAKKLYPYFTLFVRYEVDENAKFNNLTKDEFIDPDVVLASNKKDQEAWRETLAASVKKMMRWQFIEDLETKLSVEADVKVEKTEGKKKVVDKRYKPANWVSHKGKGHLCRLFITEGNSAKTSGEAGAAGVGAHDTCGFFAIRGKFINVRTNPKKKIDENEEVQLLKQILGLRTGVDYSQKENYLTLNYGSVSILTDSDEDGIHIRGLLINFFLTLFPSLFEIDFMMENKKVVFLESRSTAVIKVGYKGKVLKFYSIADYKKWAKGKTVPKGATRYYKGLGTNTHEDMVEYFEDPKDVKFYLEGDEESYVKLGFDKASEEKKTWLLRDDVETELKGDGPLVRIEREEEDFFYEGPLSVSTFIDTQLVQYHRATPRRCLPCVIDGFKENHRKIFHTFVTKVHDLVDVERASGRVKDFGYHHGDDALKSSIQAMAMGFVGSNNIPLLVNEGCFGSRLLGGDDAAAPRYTNTRLEEIARYIYVPADDPILSFMYDDGKPVEPVFYIPILPMVLVNGSKGIATGWSTDIPCYNPEDIVKWIRAWLNSPKKVDKLERLVPWYRGFKGEIELVEDEEGVVKSWRSHGVIGDLDKAVNSRSRKAGDSWLEVSELPVGVWTSSFQIYLQTLQAGDVGKRKGKGKKKKTGDEKKKPTIVDINMYNTPNTVRFEFLPTHELNVEEEITKKWLTNDKSVRNMNLIDFNDNHLHFDTPEEILLYFCPIRLKYYHLRKKYILAQKREELRVDTNKKNFIQFVLDEALVLHNPEDEDDSRVEADMEGLGLEKVEDSYGYLKNLHIWSLTKKKVDELQGKIEKLEREIEEIEATTEKDMWRQDLSAFEEAYAKFLKTRNDDVDYKKRGKKAKRD